MSDLSEYLLDRIAEDEARVRRNERGRRALAEIDAKRRLIALHHISHPCAGPCGYSASWAPCTTMRILALPYADRTDFRPEWRP